MPRLLLYSVRLRTELVCLPCTNCHSGAPHEHETSATAATGSQEQNAIWSRQLEEMFQRLEALEPEHLEGWGACEVTAGWQACSTQCHRKC